MTDFEEMYKRFRLDQSTINDLNRLASNSYPLEDSGYSVTVETLILNDGKEVKRENGVLNAELV